MENDSRIQFFKKLHRVSLLIGALTIVLPFVFWSKIPEQIPLHYNAAGVVDNWSDKSSIILIMFCIALLMGMMSIVVYFVKTNMLSKNLKEYEKSEMAMVYPMVISMNLVIQIMFAYIMFCVTTSRSLGGWFAPVFLIATFAPMVYFFVKRPKRPVKDYQMAEKEEQGVTYRSKIDWWLGLILGGCVVWMLWLTIVPIVKTGKIEWVITISTALTVAVILPLFAIKYVIYAEHMLVSCSIYGKVRISYKDIVSIKATRNPISSAALSINRLQIDYVEDGIHRMVLISPVRRKEFLKLLNERCGKEMI